mmetsp:Transcript_10759/g.14762  ORF Transcript_10759/g.14762 Transcript_10759/m.14762 type:complete len:364 (+) Transcript_10759:237-1328(+)
MTTLCVFGWNRDRQLQLTPSTSEANRTLFAKLFQLKNSVRCFDCSQTFSVACTDEGEFLCWGRSTHFNCEKIPSMIGHIKITKVSAGGNHVLLLTESRKLFSFGNNSQGQCGFPKHRLSLNIPEMVAIEADIGDCDAGYSHSIAITDAGLVYAFGSNEYGQLGIGARSTLQDQPKMLPFFTINHPASRHTYRITKVCCGWAHTILLSDSGVVFSFGWGSYLQLGHGDTDDRMEPVIVSSLMGSKICAVAAGAWHTICLTDAGAVYTFGWGHSGQLGHGNTEGCDEPKQVAALSSKFIIQVAAGTRHSAFLSKNGELMLCGYFQLSTVTEPQKLWDLPNEVEPDRTRLVAGKCSWATVCFWQLS